MKNRAFVQFAIIGIVMGALQLLCVSQFHGPIDNLPAEVVIGLFCVAPLIIVAMMPLKRRLSLHQSWRLSLLSGVFPAFLGASVLIGVANALGLVVRSWPVFWVDAALCTGLGIDALFSVLRQESR